MSLRAEQMIGVSARAAQRVANDVARISALYAPEDSEVTLLLQALAEEAKQAGHYYDEDCQRPACVEWRAYVNAALQQVLSGGGAGAGG